MPPISGWLNLAGASPQVDSIHEIEEWGLVWLCLRAREGLLKEVPRERSAWAQSSDVNG